MTVQEAIEWDNYRAIDLLKRIKREEIHERYIDRHKAFDMAIQALKEVEQYRAFGTVEELKEAREKQIPKKPILRLCGNCQKECVNCDRYVDRCPNCKGDLYVESGKPHKFCPNCGQALEEN